MVAPSRAGGYVPVSVRAMAFWIALAVLLVAVAAGIAYVVVRGLQLWRDVKRSGATIGAEVERINETALQIERHAAAAEAAAGRLQRRDHEAGDVEGTARRPARRRSRRACRGSAGILVHPRDLTAAGRSPRDHR